ncbi:MAG TPA: condensation domain-containing protein [Mycobacteriales bacterium]|nr:condensation domain-containing protein [Mycobacteriales bacterium]
MTAVAGVADRVLVPFEGEGSGVGELSWGQREMWGMIQRLGSSLAVGGVSPLPAGMSPDAAAGVLSFIMSRHQSLRTRLRFDADGRVRQAVAASGVATLEIVDAGDADPVVVAQSVWNRFHAKEFDYANEWPVRMAVIRHRAALTHVVATYCHLALDGGGVAALIADLSNLDSSTGRPTGPVRGLPPLEQARWEAGPAGQRRSTTSLGHWERLLCDIPARRFPIPTGHDRPRFQEAEYRSPAMDLAARVIAARTGVDTTPVLLAALAVGLARATGINPSVAQLIVSNRFRPSLADSASAVSMPGLCVIDVAAGTFDEVVARAWQASLSAYKNAYYDPSQRDALVARLGRERGENLDISCYVNDRRDPASRLVSGPAPTPDRIRAALAASRLDWCQVPVDPVSEPFSLRINDVPDTVEIQVAVDTQHASPATIEAFLWAAEAVTVQAALDPASYTGADPEPG